MCMCRCRCVGVGVGVLGSVSVCVRACVRACVGVCEYDASATTHVAAPTALPTAHYPEFLGSRPHPSFLPASPSAPNPPSLRITLVTSSVRSLTFLSGSLVIIPASAVGYPELPPQLASGSNSPP